VFLFPFCQGLGQPVRLMVALVLYTCYSLYLYFLYSRPSDVLLNTIAKIFVFIFVNVISTISLVLL
jgi:hypothetical protein